jgi:phosphoglycerate dehydrogenase-like enzyme
MDETTRNRASRPRIVLAMIPGLERALFHADHLAALRAMADLPETEPAVPFETERATRLLQDAEILLTGWGCPELSGAVLDRAPRLRLIAHCAGTVKEMVTPACWERGLRVITAAEANAIPVVEYTVAAILLANKHAFHIREIYRKERRYGLWHHTTPGIGNLNKRVGIVGASRIGRRVIEALRPFDFSICVYDPYLPEEEADRLGVEKVELDELLQSSDVVTLHAPSLAETRHMIGARELALIHDGAALINTARGALIDGAALEKELSTGRIRAVIDTTDPETLPADSPLYDLPNVFLTPHIAGASGTEVYRMADLIIEEIGRYLRGEPLQHEVRQEDLPRIA